MLCHELLWYELKTVKWYFTFLAGFAKVAAAVFHHGAVTSNGGNFYVSSCASKNYVTLGSSAGNKIMPKQKNHAPLRQIDS